MTVAATRFTGWTTTHPATAVTITGPENRTWPRIMPPVGTSGSTPAGPTTGRGFPR